MNAPFPCTKILVPLDFSDDSARALRYAVAVARTTGAKLVLVTVVEDRFPYPELFAWDHPNEEFYKTLRERALKHMEDLLQGQASGLAVERVVVKGRPRNEIVAVAADVQADLVVIARHGSSGLRTAFMGSTTEAVLRQSHCPVLLLPPLAGA
jgi:nucleotide-binding universal stress UspA family protein